MTEYTGPQYRANVDPYRDHLRTQTDLNVDPYRDHLRTQTDLLKSIRNGVSLIAVMLLVFAVALILAIIGASA